MLISPTRPHPFRRLCPASRSKKRTSVPRFRERRRRIVGVVLAGGLSSRMGQDKALVRLSSGESADILARTVTLLHDVCGHVIVVGRMREGYNCVPDLAPGHGPVGGIATALEHCRAAACLVLSCDLPFMNKDVLENLIAHRNARPPGMHVTAYQQQPTGNIEALVAIYEPECLPWFQTCVARKLLKISMVVPMEQQYFVPYDVRDALPFFNLNYPADLAVARHMMRMLGRQ